MVARSYRIKVAARYSNQNRENGAKLPNILLAFSTAISRGDPHPFHFPERIRPSFSRLSPEVFSRERTKTAADPRLKLTQLLAQILNEIRTKHAPFSLFSTAFGLGCMIYCGMELGSFFEIPWNSPCYQVLRGINPILQMVFTFSQMYFVFMNARVRD